ncbi:MAG: hypothetical protein A3J83_02155 [Elusimicrobia bacterium RIFOXYA2_FULL_40_6]|nr:MAG: hypothetical protein A3J83_02155 [Elusimicrobia bacterium RIFOXYA2_FULL_40_6]
MLKNFIAKQKQLEKIISKWKKTAKQNNLKVDYINTYTGHKNYTLTISNFKISSKNKKALYIGQSHAHEPATTAGMVDFINQLLTGRDLNGRPTQLDVESILSQMTITFNPIGNPDGRERAPVTYWDGSKYTNDQFWCWMRGEDPDNPGKMWLRLEEWDTRKIKHPKPIGVVYEQVSKYKYVEPNRSRLGSYYRLFMKMDKKYKYDRWLDLHQTEFVKRPDNCEILLPFTGLDKGKIKKENIDWGKQIIAGWKKAGFKPKSEPYALGKCTNPNETYRGYLYRRMPIIATEVKNNAKDFPPENQLKSNIIAITETIKRMTR